MKSYEQLTKDLLERRDQYVINCKNKKKKIVRIATPICCFFLVGVLVLGVYQGGAFSGKLPVESSFPVVSKAETLESKDFSSLVSQQEENIGFGQSVINNPNSSQTVAESAPLLQENTLSPVTSVPGPQLNTDLNSTIEAQGKPITSNSTESKGESSNNSEEDTEAPEGLPPYPVFSSIHEFETWLTSHEESDRFAEQKKALLKTLIKGNQIVYYRPTLGNGNTKFQLEGITISDYNVLKFVYKLVDDSAKKNSFLTIYCYLDETFKKDYIQAQKDWENQQLGYESAIVNGHKILYRDNQVGATSFLWPQWGGYSLAFFSGKNHFQKAKEVIPYLDLEKVVISY